MKTSRHFIQTSIALDILDEYTANLTFTKNVNTIEALENNCRLAYYMDTYDINHIDNCMLLDIGVKTPQPYQDQTFIRRMILEDKERNS